MSVSHQASNWKRAAFSEKVDLKPVAALRTLGRKARRHPTSQIALICDSLKQFGFIAPILIDDECRIIAGNGRHAAALKLGYESVPCLTVTHLTEAEKRAYALADNQLGTLSDWDDEALAAEFAELALLDDAALLGATGFSSALIEELIDEDVEQAAAPEPERPDDPISQVGDIWECGRHLVGCLDATLPQSLQALAPGENFAAVITDAPFNISIRGFVSSEAAHREFVQGSGEMNDDEFTDFLVKAYGLGASALRDGGLLYAAMDWRHMSHVLAAAKTLQLTLLNLCVWAKPAAGQGSFYRSQHELFFVFKKPGAPHNNRVRLGSNGRSRSNVWHYEGVVGGGRRLRAAHHDHPSPKPPPLILDILKDCTERGEIVYDGFGGGGSLLVACEQSGRCGRLMDLDPGYVDVMVERWQRLSGAEAKLRGDGRSFAVIAVERSVPKSLPTALVRTRTRKPAEEV